MLPAMVVFLKPRCQRCRDSKIVVAMEFWEADSRHARELRVFLLREKNNSLLPARGQKVQKTLKSDTTTLEFEVSFCARFWGTGDPLLPMGESTSKLSGTLLGRLWEALGRLGEAL